MKQNKLEPDDYILDDHMLLQDKLLRLMHRNSEGHVASSTQHTKNVKEDHNAIVFYVYHEVEKDCFELSEEYLYINREKLNYRKALKYANEHAPKIVEKFEGRSGIYAWCTSYIRVTPIRNGDLFICIDVKGARGVRLTFDRRKDGNNARQTAQKGLLRSSSNRNGQRNK